MKDFVAVENNNPCPCSWTWLIMCALSIFVRTSVSTHSNEKCSNPFSENIMYRQSRVLEYVYLVSRTGQSSRRETDSHLTRQVLTLYIITRSNLVHFIQARNYRSCVKRNDPINQTAGFTFCSTLNWCVPIKELTTANVHTIPLEH